MEMSSLTCGEVDDNVMMMMMRIDVADIIATSFLT